MDHEELTGGTPAAADRRRDPAVNPVVDILAAYTWRLLVIGAGLLAVLWLVSRLRFVMIALVVGIFVGRILTPVVHALRARGVRAGLAAGLVLVGFLLLLVGLLTSIGLAAANQVGDLGETVSDAVDDVETWVVEDSPFDIERADIDRFREQAADTAREVLESGERGGLVSGAIATVEALVAVLLGLIVAFFGLKDGGHFRTWTLGLFPERRRPLLAKLGHGSWDTLGGFLRGAALLGFLEGVIFAITLVLIGGELAVPVAVLTFLGAFVPFLGAIVSALVAVLVALATAGVGGALVMAVVALIVQQLDNEVLAPVIYGRALSMHPVAVLLGIAAGGALFGLPGSFLAVPVTAVLARLATDLRAEQRQTTT